MARPAKPMEVSTGARTKEEIAIRTAISKNLAGNQDIACPDYLSSNQRKIFDGIVDHFIEAGILSSIDSITLSEFCIAIDRLRDIETKINSGELDMFDSKVTATRAKYESTMWRGCNEFCLSPQARAKIGSLFTAKRKDETDPLMEALKCD